MKDAEIQKIVREMKWTDIKSREFHKGKFRDAYAVYEGKSQDHVACVAQYSVGTGLKTMGSIRWLDSPNIVSMTTDTAEIACRTAWLQNKKKEG